MDLWGIFLRTIFIYFFIFLMMRLMGKREVGKLSVFDLIVSFMIADISAISLEDLERPLTVGLFPIATIVSLQIILSYLSLKSNKVRHWIDGLPSIIIKDGEIQKKTMQKARYNLDDLMVQLREKNISDIRDVAYAILETSGKLSVFPKKEHQPATKEDIESDSHQSPFQLPVPVITDGKVNDEQLSEIGQNRFWLKNQIKKHGYNDFKEIFYASVDKRGDLFIHPASTTSKWKK